MGNPNCVTIAQLGSSENVLARDSRLSAAHFLATDPEWSAYCDVLRVHPFLSDFAHAVGGTSLVSLPSPRSGVTILAKCEWQNPCGSIKDRTALILMLDHLMTLDRGASHRTIVLEYSGGNLALSLAYLCRGLGQDLHLVLSDGTSSHVCDMLRQQGVELTLVDKKRGFLAVIREAERIAVDRRYRFLYQHENDLNWKFHALTSGREILAQCPHPILGWVASVGTGGTFSGVFKTLRTKYPNVVGYAVTPAELPYGSFEPPNGLSKYAGSGGLGFGIRQRFVATCETGLIEFPSVSYQAALNSAATLFRSTGLRVGSSGGANYCVAFEQAAQLDEGTIVTVLPCRGAEVEWHEVQRIARDQAQ